MRVAAYQAPLLRGGSMEALDLIRKRVVWCETEGVEILCCPEGMLGGLADYYHGTPTDIALDVESGQLARVLEPLASDTVTTIVGFSETSHRGHLWNSAAVFHKGAVLGVYRKLHPAINKSVYQPGDGIRIFEVNGLKFGILICNDSNYPELASELAAQGATALFIPSNNALPPERPDVAAYARAIDIALAIDHGLTVIRADVAGSTAELVSSGSSLIVYPDGTVAQSAQPMTEALLVAEVRTADLSGHVNNPAAARTHSDNHDIHPSLLD